MATRWLLLAYLSCTAWSYAIGPRDVARPDGPVFRLTEPVAPEGAHARDNPPGRAPDLETRNATIIRVSAEEARRSGFPGFAGDDDDDDPGRSRRALDELGETLAKRVIHSWVQKGSAHYICPTMSEQSRDIDFAAGYDDSTLTLTISRSTTGDSVDMPYRNEITWTRGTVTVPYSVPFAATIYVEVSNPDGTSWCCTATMSWTQKFAAEPQEDGSYVIAIFQPATGDATAIATCIQYTGMGSGCKAAQIVNRFSCSAADVQWING